MKMLTKADQSKLPALYSQDGKDPSQVKVPVKFFSPYSNWTWYATEYDPDQRLFFGYVKGHENELGYFSLDELESATKMNGKLPLVERDKWWDSNTTLADVMAGKSN